MAKQLNAVEVHDEPWLTNTHFTLFGRIVSIYAHVEGGFRMALGGLLDLSLVEISVLAEPYRAQDLKNVTKAVAKLRMKPKDAERLVWLVGQFGTFGPIRNHIGHHRWTRGTRPGSIRPVQMEIRSGKAEPKGYQAHEPDYTVDDLIKSANGLYELDQQLRDFLIKVGLAEAVTRSATKERPLWKLPKRKSKAKRKGKK